MFSNLLIALPLYWVILIFCLSGIGIWFSGKYLIVFGDVLGETTTFGHAFIGALFLGFITSLPEISTTITASMLGNISLALSNLIGGIIIQTTILAVADCIFVKKALTSIRLSPVLLLSALFLIFQLAITIVGFSIGEVVHIAKVGLWPLILSLLYILSLYLLKSRYKKEEDQIREIPEKYKKYLQKSHAKIGFAFAFCGILVFICGYFVTIAVDALAFKTNIASGFLGATILAFLTSLPEISTTFAAMRIQSYTMAFSNIFGSNSLMLAIIILADIASPDRHVFDLMLRPLIFLCGIGIIVTGIYIFGLLERKDHKFLRMGIDSILVLLVSLFGLCTLYFLTR